MVEGLSHITFVVRDLDRMASFLKIIFNAEEVYSSGSNTFSISKEKFFLINGIWIAVMEGEPLSEKTYNHIAFKIADQDFEKYVDRVKSLSVEFREGRSRVEGEGDSLYFYDYDNHLFELHTGTLEQRLARYHRAATA
ncbi:MAG: FosX/FosE/FosI family fosfomycin resistance hydrolase [Phormidium tanganyikae FI6-MK23]|nr:FosX/FosE/FosI family fosfomycin resistance hydrolase [Phormidium tanganyikae FI6-MK23]